ncbi:hypothetical protein [Autumnicola psychrophila]|uniref:Transposase n=1 Tax=Autumnicola psychrophila TaxID=3075592 RepID=A0ABU3DQA8_9FLAO|nr:hypothetical protein [Zunongwangia sp. F225]MDT0685798.1 hypothetical protein [Zunongwangia sp. F225]
MVMKIINHKSKEYNQQQNWHLLPFFEELIFGDHPVKIVNGVIEHLDIQPLIFRK